MTDQPRRTGYLEGESNVVPAIESRPDDPSDFDELIAAARDAVDYWNPGKPSIPYEERIKRLRKALEGSKGK